MLPAASVNTICLSLTSAKSHAIVMLPGHARLSQIAISTTKLHVWCIGVVETNLHARCYRVANMEPFTNDLEYFSSTCVINNLKIAGTPAWTKSYITNILPAANIASSYTHTL